jgi:hypothetical protein
MDNKALVTEQVGELQVDPMISMIERMAMNPEVDVEKLERLMAMQEKMINRDAETQFNKAMAEVQADMRRVAADSNNPQTSSRYASYAALDKALRPIYTENGFSLSFDTGETTIEDSVKVLCYVSHAMGHTRTYHADIDASGKGAKGGNVMTKTHAAGSAMSYGMRYLLKMIFNVAVGENDDDGNSAGQVVEYITEEMVNILHSKLTENEIDTKKFDSWLKRDLKVDSLEGVSMQAYKTVDARINSAIRAKAAE